MVISMLEALMGRCMRSLEKIRILSLGPLLVTLSASSTAQFSQSVVDHTAPSPVLAGGEPVLAHSQIHFHDAPALSPPYLRFDRRGCTLAGHDSVGTRTA